MKIILIAITVLINTFFLSIQLLHAEAVESQQPMYGASHEDDVDTSTIDKHELFTKAVRTFGTREHASEGYTESGFDHYANAELGQAMERFNQAWLLNPENPYPYLGLALLMNNDRQPCEAYRLFKLANEYGLSESGFLADYAYTTSQCALTKKQLQQEMLFEQANGLHDKSTQNSNRVLLAYAYQLWAKSFLLQGKLDKVQAMINAAREQGGEIAGSLLDEIKTIKQQSTGK